MATVIRRAAAGDAAAIAAIYAPAVTGRATSFEFEPPDAAEMAARVARCHPAYPWLVAERAGEVIGYAYGSRHRERAAYGWSVEVSAYVRGDAHRAGVGRGLYTALFAILALQGYRRAFAGMTLPNPSSAGLHLAMGFRPIGVFEGVGFKFGQWHDVAWFGRDLAPLEGAPAPPLGLDAVEPLPAFGEALRAGAALIRTKGGLP
jgi:phosphinothricin acetyltransferase